VQQAISSPASFYEGAKSTAIPVGGFGAGATDFFPNQKGPGLQNIVTHTGSGAYVTETVRDGTQKEPKGISNCKVCGGPGKFRCSACNVTRYCSAICQKKDWKEHKLTCGGKKKSAGKKKEKK
jgi:hypothetical protein